MTSLSTNKIKTINDPVYGFITIPCEEVFDVMEHPWFQRLRRIRQLGLTHYVYPSAHHTRFQHALGAMHLMTQAVKTLRTKRIEISPEEAEGAYLAILLHDIGHGPFSHTLEQSIVRGLPHEELSLRFISELNHKFNGMLDLALQIFSGGYPRRFLHQLVSSQLDMDRMDYLSRDSFFTGVAEGTINTDRIIHVLTVCNDELAVEDKGVYSVEKFLIARRLMFWQVYLHKAVLSADQMLISLLCRARDLAEAGQPLFSTPAFGHFLREAVNPSLFCGDTPWLERFACLDDHDVVSSIKVWTGHPDTILSTLSRNLLNRKLFRLELSRDPFDPEYIEEIRRETARIYHLGQDETHYFVRHGTVRNDAYVPSVDSIQVKTGSGTVTDIFAASDQLNIGVLSTPVSRNYLSYPKEVTNGQLKG